MYKSFVILIFLYFPFNLCPFNFKTIQRFSIFFCHPNNLFQIKCESNQRCCWTSDFQQWQLDLRLGRDDSDWFNGSWERSNSGKIHCTLQTKWQQSDSCSGMKHIINFNFNLRWVKFHNTIFFKTKRSILREILLLSN